MTALPPPVDEAALAELRARVEQDPQSLKWWRRLANALTAVPDFQGAEQAWRRALALEPHDFAARQGLGLALTRQGRLEEAVTHLDAAAGLQPLNLTAQVLLAQILERADDQAKSAAAWERVLEIDPGHDEAKARLAWLRFCVDRRVEYEIGPQDWAAFRQAMEALAGGEAARAEALFAGLAGRRPDHAAGWAGWRGALHAQGRRGEAAELEHAWRRAAPAAGPAIAAAMGRPLSVRGLMFDPREPLPLRLKEEALARAESAAELKRPGDRWLTLDSGGDAVEHRSFLALAGEDPDRIVGVGARPETFVLALDNAALAGRGAIVTQRGELIADLHYPAEKFGTRPSGTGLAFDPALLADGACSVRVFDRPALVMTGPADRSYGDWINNYPPRLALAEAAGLGCDVVVRSNPPPQFIDMLAALGVGRERILFHDLTGVSVFPRLYAPSWPMPSRLHPMRNLYGVYRRAQLEPPAGERPLIYLTRKHMRKRSLVNEPEVAELFARKGFEVVAPETLSFEQTRALFAGPACVAGPYGSALRSMVFSRNTPVCLVLMPPYPQPFQDGTALWMGELGVRLATVQGVAAGNVDGAASANSAPWTVGLDQVEAAIDQTLELAPR